MGHASDLILLSPGLLVLPSMNALAMMMAPIDNERK